MSDQKGSTSLSPFHEKREGHAPTTDCCKHRDLHGVCGLVAFHCVVAYEVHTYTPLAYKKMTNPFFDTPTSEDRSTLLLWYPLPMRLPRGYAPRNHDPTTAELAISQSMCTSTPLHTVECLPHLSREIPNVTPAALDNTVNATPG